MKKVNVKAVATYKGHGVRENGNVSLSLKFQYDELTHTVMMLQMLNNDVSLVVKKPDSKAMNIGSFRINSVGIDGDGESVVKLSSMTDFVEMNNLNDIVTKDPFQIKMTADIEEELEEDE